MDKPERLMRDVVDACTDCDCCRYIMDTSCLFFPEVYRLWDRERETGEGITEKELRKLADLCNYCALCPCPNIREDIITAKTAFIDRDGLDPYIRTLEDVERVGKLCGALPWLSNFLLQSKLTGDTLKKSLGINPKRKLPAFPPENFSKWARRQKLHLKPKPSQKRKVAYFSGCTARYLFPDVPKAAVTVLKLNGIEVFYPDQQCCGMPCMLEGDRKLTLRFAGRTVDQLAEITAEGFDIVCSCPTCGFMIKHALRQGAYYSRKYQASVGGNDDILKIPVEEKQKDSDTTKAASGLPEQYKVRFGEHHMTHVTDPATQSTANPGDEREFLVLDKSIYGKIMTDTGYFSSIDPMKRIQVAENAYDLGEYLRALHTRGELNTDFGPVAGSMVYYPPCHLREQEMGMPYMDLLKLVPDIFLEPIQSSFYCCGIAGIMGFKRDFHKASVQMGSRLMGKIKQINPDKLVTDCLSCRLQFNQMTSYDVSHPIEILKEAYEKG